MKSKFIIAFVAAIICSGQAKGQKSVFDDSPEPSKTRDEPSRDVKNRADRPDPPPSKPPAQSSDELIDELNAKILQLQKENDELKSKVKDLTEALAAVETKDSAKDKAKQEREQRVAAAKQKAETERVARIKAGMSLSEAEFLARTKAKVTSSEIVHLQPRVGYFGPLDIRKDHCTLTVMKNGEACEISLVVMDGVITELTTH
ncbi:MAG: hypothetical protein JWL69_3889 [Phycisphaerales bacterium]|nr:hypothetical protein [Phycisphaerales bacterium]